MNQDRPKDWRELCHAAANESDPTRLMDLIVQLTRALDQRDQKLKCLENGNGRSNYAESLPSESA